MEETQNRLARFFNLAPSRPPNGDKESMIITGERKFEKEEKDKKYHRVERAYGNFLRSFELPDAADRTKVNAEFKDGVLRVHLPKNEKAALKAIDVKVS